MVYMSQSDDPECYRCERDDRDLTEHTLRFTNGEPPKTVDLCPSCVRLISQGDNAVRSIT